MLDSTAHSKCCSALANYYSNNYYILLLHLVCICAYLLCVILEIISTVKAGAVLMCNKYFKPNSGKTNGSSLQQELCLHCKG